MKVSKHVKLLSLVMLAAVLCTLCILHLEPNRAVKLFNSYINLIPFLFLGITLQAKHSKRSIDVWMGYLWVAWFLISRVLLKDYYLVSSSVMWFSYECLACLFAIAFAWGTDDGVQKTGIKLTAVVMLTVYTILCLAGLYAAWTEQMIILPGTTESIGVGGDARLNILSHPNTTGAFAVITFALGVWLMAGSRFRGWIAVPLCAMLAVIYIVCALTTSRTSMLQIACFLGMMAAILVLRHPPKQLKKRLTQFACAFVAAGLVFALSFESFGWIVNGWNTARNSTQSAIAETIPEPVAEPVAEPEKVSEQVSARPIGRDLGTLTGRTDIWARGIELLRSNASMRWFGSTSQIFPELEALTAHNSYLQVAMCLGIPGLLLALCFTVRILWLCIRVFFLQFNKATLTEQILACMLPMLLINTISEPIVFYHAVPVYNVIFFLVYGYLSETDRRLRQAR